MNRSDQLEREQFFPLLDCRESDRECAVEDQV